MNDWWRSNREAGKVSVVFSYALGKAQRILAGLDPSIGPILCHGAVERVNEDYRNSGIALPDTSYAGRYEHNKDWAGAIVIAPPSANGTTWMRKFGDASRAFASGWMLIRGTRRRRAVERGFVLSDHADWPGLLSAIQATGADRILATHGRTGPMVQWLCNAGYDAAPLQTRFVGERDDADVDDIEDNADTIASAEALQGDASTEGLDEESQE
jgi:putative mRNA 3-end processing factor